VEEEMKKNVIISLIVMLVLGLSLIGCENPTETKEVYEPIAPVTNYSTLSELIEAEEGAFFQNASRSLRFFPDGDFQVFGMGLFNDIFPSPAGFGGGLAYETTYGSRYILDGNTIKIYRKSDTNDAAPFYTITYTLEGHTLTITGKTAGAAAAPNNTAVPTGAYSYGKLPFYHPEV
jgi:hypothetical protein